MCTTIKIDYNNGYVLGRNMDFEAPIEYKVQYLPENYPILTDLYGNEIKSKYRTLGLVFKDHIPYKDAVNSKGLIGCTNMFLGMNLYSDEVVEGKVNVAAVDLLNYILGNFKDVDEIIENIENIHLSNRDSNGNKAISPDFHHMFVDKKGKCIVVEPFNKKLTYYDNPYNVMTNSPKFPTMVDRLKKTMDISDLDSFNGGKDLPGGYDPLSRFIKAFYMTNTAVKSETKEQAYQNVYPILEALKMPKGFFKNQQYQYYTYTRYQCAYSTDLDLTVRTETNNTVYGINLNDIKSNERILKEIETKFEIKDISDFGV